MRLSSMAPTTEATYPAVAWASWPRVRSWMKSAWSVDTSATGAKFTLMPRPRSRPLFSRASSAKMSPWPEEASASSWGDWNRWEASSGLELTRTTVPPSSSTPMSRGRSAAP